MTRFEHMVARLEERVKREHIPIDQARSMLAQAVAKWLDKETERRRVRCPHCGGKT